MPLANNFPLLGFWVQCVDHSLILSNTIVVIPGSGDGFELVGDGEDIIMTMKFDNEE